MRHLAPFHFSLAKGWVGKLGLNQYLNDFPSPGHGLGDPHYKTFDNQYYDFQGNGEYIYVELLDTDGNVIYHVQGRIGFIPAWNSNRVTGHRSVAFGSPNNPKKGFQVKDKSEFIKSILIL